jgi:hypothetical protein
MLLGYFERLDEYADDDPYPVNIPGHVVPSDKLREYNSGEFYHYLTFYARVKRVGNPFNRGWLNWPLWRVQLLMAFDAAREAVSAYNQQRANEDYQRQAAARRGR